MLRNPEDYLTSSNGKRYDENQSANLVNTLTSFLSKYNINGINNRLLLQVLTHKSFAHGKKPFNEKLSIFGIHLLREAAAIHTLKTPIDEKYSNNPVEGLNFDSLGNFENRKLFHKTVLSNYIRSNIPSIEKDIFWRNRNILITDPATNGENVVLSDVLTGLIGAVNLSKGKETTMKFIEEAILNGENSLIKINEKFSYKRSEK